MSRIIEQLAKAKFGGNVKVYPWFIDEKHFCHEIVTDFPEYVFPMVDTIQGTVRNDDGHSENALAFYWEQLFSTKMDELVEIRWKDCDNEVRFKARQPVAEAIAKAYKQWIEEGETGEEDCKYFCHTFKVVGKQDEMFAKLYQVVTK